MFFIVETKDEKSFIFPSNDYMNILTFRKLLIAKYVVYLKLLLYITSIFIYKVIIKLVFPKI